MLPFPTAHMTIDSLYQELLDEINDDGRTESISAEFSAIKETSKRVFFVYKLLKTYNLTPIVLKEDKCELSCIHYRNLGNILYSRGDLHMAWQYYNLSLMYSPQFSLSYCLAVANRSAVLVRMKKYKECLEDIQLVFTLAYPPAIRDKLLKRKKRCEDALKKAEDPGLVDENEQVEDIFTFKGTKHEIYVDASEKLEVKDNNIMGRHIVAKNDIEVGEIIVQEDPYVRVLLRSQLLTTCGHCFSQAYNLYPCPYCTLTMYCSKLCATQAWEEYHSFECPLIASLVKVDFTKLEWLALRTTIKARKDYSSLDNVLKAVEETDLYANSKEFGCKQTKDGNLIYSSKHYNSIHALATNFEKRDISDIFQKTVTAAVLMHYLAVVKFVETDDSELKRKLKIFTAETLMQHLMTAPTNMHSITATAQDGQGNYVDEYNIGSGAYPFLSLINHSCSPNVVRYTRLGTSQMTLIALRPIKKGMQVFDNYGYIESYRLMEEIDSPLINEIPPSDRTEHCSCGPGGNSINKVHHAVQCREKRQEVLKYQYKFTCICEACVGDWPLYNGLNPITDPPPRLASKINELLNSSVIEALQVGDKKRALKIYKPLCELATALEPYNPCKELAECQEALKQCLAIFCGTVPFDSIRCIDWGIPAAKVEGSPETTRIYIGAGAYNFLDDI